MQQAEFQLAQQRLGELLGKAAEAAAAEQWQAALQQYEAALAIDGALGTAREGKQQAETRRALDQALEARGAPPRPVKEQPIRLVRRAPAQARSRD